MLVNVNGSIYSVNIESILINTIAFIGLFVSIFDGYNPAFAAIGLFILDSIRNPYPNVLDVTEEVDDEGNIIDLNNNDDDDLI